MNRRNFIRSLAVVPFISIADLKEKTPDIQKQVFDTPDIQKQVFDTLYTLIHTHNMTIEQSVLTVIEHLTDALYLEEDTANHDLIADLEYLYSDNA